MNWYKFSKSQITEDDLNDKLKPLVKKHPLFRKMMQDYNVPNSEVDTGLMFRISDLGDKHAEANGEEIIFNKNLFTDGNFYKERLFFLVHEFFHWVKRKSEQLFYFNDPEETQSFELSIAWELLNGTDESLIMKKIYPIVNAHFKDKGDAREMFAEMLRKAKEIAVSFR